MGFKPGEGLVGAFSVIAKSSQTFVSPSFQSLVLVDNLSDVLV